jgi:hypothetical protein
MRFEAVREVWFPCLMGVVFADLGLNKEVKKQRIVANPHIL